MIFVKVGPAHVECAIAKPRGNPSGPDVTVWLAGSTHIESGSTAFVRGAARSGIKTNTSAAVMRSERS